MGAMMPPRLALVQGLMPGPGLMPGMAYAPKYRGGIIGPERADVVRPAGDVTPAPVLTGTQLAVATADQAIQTSAALLQQYLAQENAAKLAVSSAGTQAERDAAASQLATIEANKEVALANIATNQAALNASQNKPVTQVIADRWNAMSTTGKVVTVGGIAAAGFGLYLLANRKRR
jgi:hypothetical protein